ncbi:MAG: hypothetical protein IPL83_07650 [Bdellovibrionales bacterium]|nr:hypothetical protein [Bdellovibrionales bacterium]
MKLCKLKTYLAVLFTLLLYFPSAHASAAQMIDQESVYGWLNGRTSSMVGIVNSHWKNMASHLAHDPRTKIDFLKLSVSKLEENNTIYNVDFIETLNQFIPNISEIADTHIDSGLYATLIQLRSLLKQEKVELEGKGGVLDNLSCLWLCDPASPEIQDEIRRLTSKIDNALIEFATAGKVEATAVMAALEASSKGQLDLFSLTKITYYSLKQLRDPAGARATIQVSDFIRKFSREDSFTLGAMPVIDRSDLGFINEDLKKRNLLAVDNWPDYAKEFRRQVLTAAYSAQPEITYTYLHEVIVDRRHSARRQEGYIFLNALEKRSVDELVSVSNELFTSDDFDIYLRSNVVHQLAKSNERRAIQHSRIKIENFSNYSLSLKVVAVDIEILEKYADPETLNILADKLAQFAERLEKQKEQYTWAKSASGSAARASFRGYSARKSSSGSSSGFPTSPRVFTEAADSYISGRISSRQILIFLSAAIKNIIEIKGELLSKIMKICSHAVETKDSDVVAACAGEVLLKLIAVDESSSSPDKITDSIYKLVNLVASKIEEPNSIMSCAALDKRPILVEIQRILNQISNQTLTITSEPKQVSDNLLGKTIKVGYCNDIGVTYEYGHWNDKLSLEGESIRSLGGERFYVNEGYTPFVALLDGENISELRLCRELVYPVLNRNQLIEIAKVMGQTVDEACGNRCIEDHPNNSLTGINDLMEILYNKTDFSNPSLIALGEKIQSYKELQWSIQRGNGGPFVLVNRTDKGIARICGAAELGVNQYIKFFSPKN